MRSLATSDPNRLVTPRSSSFTSHHLPWLAPTVLTPHCADVPPYGGGPGFLPRATAVSRRPAPLSAGRRCHFVTFADGDSMTSSPEMICCLRYSTAATR